MRLGLSALFLLACFSTLFAQLSPAPDVQTDFLLLSGKKKKEKEEPAPLALALNLAFGATIWAEVKISTNGPIVDMTKLVKEGYYKLELIQLILMSAEGRHPLKDTLKKRKKGEKLSRIAADYHLDYDKLYESALAVEELVDRDYLPRFPEKRPRKEEEP